MKRILLMLTLALVALAGCEKEPAAVEELKDPANCYIVSKAGTYSFIPTKGGSSAVGDIHSVRVLWESYGTDIAPARGDLVHSVSFSDNKITFTATDRKGNAVIAARDASGTILWSWHIWLTDKPEEQVYFNGAGTFMDRNLGATSATPGQTASLGLLYQWGRKDPFLNSHSINASYDAKSSYEWPSHEPSSSTTGRVGYAIANPTTFIGANSTFDWLLNNNVYNPLWTESDESKSIYDPCPAGWRVPDWDVWTKAFGSPVIERPLDFTNKGVDFNGLFGNDPVIWYPAAGWRIYYDGTLESVGDVGHYWSASPSDVDDKKQFMLSFNNPGKISLSDGTVRSIACSVRCVKEDSAVEEPVTDLKDPANCYIVSKAGTYSFIPTKGGSSAVGDIHSVEVLWATYGTDVAPASRYLVHSVSFSDNRITFTATDRKGNAVIAARDASGTILWSWHIWLTDKPEEQVYFNGAGTFMDRNLGATSATPGQATALGLLYQWGRKDPFLNSHFINASIDAKSSYEWPSYELSSSTTGRVEYAIANPTTFIVANSTFDWLLNNNVYNPLWTESDESKSVYDPCPAGWRVPDWDVWTKAFGSPVIERPLDFTNKGVDFNGLFGNDPVIWYPAAGRRIYYNGTLESVGDVGYYWSASPSDVDDKKQFMLSFNNSGKISLSDGTVRSIACSVRCVKE